MRPEGWSLSVRRLVSKQIRSRYLFTMASGESFDGLLVDCDPDHYLLADAESVSTSGDRLKVDGHLWLPRPNVLYMQQPRL
jgi:hypothetical protein